MNSGPLDYRTGRLTATLQDYINCNWLPADFWKYSSMNKLGKASAEQNRRMFICKSKKYCGQANINFQMFSSASQINTFCNPVSQWGSGRSVIGSFEYQRTRNWTTNWCLSTQCDIRAKGTQPAAGNSVYFKPFKLCLFQHRWAYIAMTINTS